MNAILTKDIFLDDGTLLAPKGACVKVDITYGIILIGESHFSIAPDEYSLEC